MKRKIRIYTNLNLPLSVSSASSVSHSREEYRKRKTCTDKTAFKTQQEAYQKGQANYKCPYCHQWHRSGAVNTFVNTFENGTKKLPVKKKKGGFLKDRNQTKWNALMKVLKKRKA